MIRAFIIFHDCGHGSFFKSTRANEVVGFVTGLLAFTPYQRWRHMHAIHHATSGDLDRWGVGDVYTMTVQEYLDAPWWKKTGYRTWVPGSPITTWPGPTGKTRSSTSSR